MQVSVEFLGSLKLKEVKQHVYEIAGVKTTKQLRRKFNADYRRKQSWLKAFQFLCECRAKSSQQTRDNNETYYTTSGYFANKVVRKWYSIEDKRWYCTPQGDLNRFKRMFPDIKIETNRQDYALTS